MAVIGSTHSALVEAPASQVSGEANPAGDLVTELNNLFEWVEEVNDDPDIETYWITCDCAD